MKKLLLFLVALVSALTASAQDVIVKTDGSTVLCKVVEVNGSAVVYLKWEDLDGPRYAIERTQIANVNFQDGRQEKINDQTVNAYAPNNQQTGNWNYNDNSLLVLDKTRSDINSKKIKQLKNIGLAVGIPVTTIGVAGIILGIIWDGQGDENSDRSNWSKIAYVGGGVFTVGGVATTTVCLLRANKLKEQAYQLSCTPVIQHEFNLKNGKSLAAGVDVIRDNQFKNTALGLGLKFNF